MVVKKETIKTTKYWAVDRGSKTHLFNTLQNKLVVRQRGGIHNSRHVFPLSSGFELHSGIGDSLCLLVNTNDDGGHQGEWEPQNPEQHIVRPHPRWHLLHHLHIAVHCCSSTFHATLRLASHATYLVSYLPLNC